MRTLKKGLLTLPWRRAGFSKEWVWGFRLMVEGLRGVPQGEGSRRSVRVRSPFSKGTPRTWTWICEPNKYDIWVREFVINEADKVGNN